MTTMTERRRAMTRTDVASPDTTGDEESAPDATAAAARAAGGLERTYSAGDLVDVLSDAVKARRADGLVAGRGDTRGLAVAA